MGSADNERKRKRREMLYKLQKGRCAICRKMRPLKVLTIDHIMPKSKGGSNDIRNLQLACKSCNEKKGNIVPKHLRDQGNRAAVPYMTDLELRVWQRQFRGRRRDKKRAKKRNRARS